MNMAARPKNEQAQATPKPPRKRKYLRTYWQIRFPEFVRPEDWEENTQQDCTHEQATAILQAVPLSSLFAIELEDADAGRVYWVYEFSHPANDFAMPDLPERVTLRQHYFEDCECADCHETTAQES